MKKSVFLILLFLLSLSSFAQDITNTLGATGVFKIKDGSTDYLSLDQSTGNTTFYRNLELGGDYFSTSLKGVITKNGIPFLHNYKASETQGYNTFVGLGAGNFTMGGTLAETSLNTGVGHLALTSLTTGSENSAFGFWAAYSNSGGYQNSAFGTKSFLQIHPDQIIHRLVTQHFI
jgi:hypothetical protein